MSILQEKHAEEQTSGHGPQEIQHGSQEGTKRNALNQSVCVRDYKMNNDVCVCVCVQGIQFLIENDLLKNTREDIARFLYKGEGLNKTAIGDYLGER